MTCLATDVYPLPSYVWDDITCENNKGSTCTFTPRSPGNITKATCIVKRQKFDGFGNKLASKSVRLNFKCKYTVFHLLLLLPYIYSCSSQDQIKILPAGECVGRYLCENLDGSFVMYHKYSFKTFLVSKTFFVNHISLRYEKEKTRIRPRKRYVQG